MKHLRSLAFQCAIVLSVVMLYSCGAGNKDALPVPKDASFVMYVNTKSLTSKLSWEDIKKTNWFSRITMDETDSLQRQILENPESSGVDTRGDLVFFVRNPNSKQTFFGFTGRVKDAAAFEAFNKKVGKNAATEKDGDINSIKIDDRSIASWTGDKFLYVFEAGTPYAGMTMPDMSGTDSVSMDQFDSAGNYIPPPPTPREPVDMKAYVKNMFSLKGDSLLVSDSRYTDMLKADGDMHLWMSAESTYDGMMSGFMSMLKLDKYLEGTVSTNTLTFENGKISVKSKTYSNKDMTNLFKKYEGDDFSTSLLQRIPSDNVVGVMALNYKPEGLKEFLKLGGLDGLINGFLGEAGITIEDFVAANKGDLLLAVTDFRLEEQSIDLGNGEKFTSKKPNINVIFSTTVGNKAAFDKLMAVGQRMNRSTDTTISYNLNNELFVIGNNRQAVDQFFKGGNKSFPFTSKISGHPFGMYLDLHKIIESTAPTTPDSTARIAHTASLAMWQDMVATGGEFKDGGIVQEFEVNLVDKNTNSLKQLSNYADKMAMAKQRGF